MPERLVTSHNRLHRTCPPVLHTAATRDTCYGRRPAVPGTPVSDAVLQCPPVVTIQRHIAHGKSGHHMQMGIGVGGWVGGGGAKAIPPCTVHGPIEGWWLGSRAHIVQVWCNGACVVTVFRVARCHELPG